MDTIDLHALCNQYGNAIVAKALKVTERALIDLRRGHTAITVDDLYELKNSFPGFDIGKTIDRIGKRREGLRKSRKFKQPRPSKFL